MRAAALPVLLLALAARGGRAAGGADALLESLGADPADVRRDGETAEAPPAFDLSDPFLMHVFTAWRTRGDLDYDTDQWVRTLLGKEFRQAAHLLSAVGRRVPGGFRPTFLAAGTYLHWRLGLGQTLVDSWLGFAEDPANLRSPAGAALSRVLDPHAFDLVLDRAPSLSPGQRAVLERVLGRAPRTGMGRALGAWAAIKGGTAAEPLLESAPPGHPMKIPLARTAALGRLRLGDVARAGGILKRHLEPAIERAGDPALARRHHLMIARLLYQVGNLDASEAFYRMVPNDTDDHLRAQTELAWILLRRGDLGRLKGLLATLGGGLFKDFFNPEVHLVRAIANLKLCRYGDVRRDLEAFVARGRADGALIARAAREGPPLPGGARDYHVSLQRRGLAGLAREAAALEGLARESVAAVLPAVGPQPHWRAALDGVSRARERRERGLAEERRRFWRAREAVLREAARKMRFVKVELMSQLHALAGEEGGGTARADRVSTLKAAPAREGGQVFPFDDVVWSDELFSHQALAESLCLKRKAGGGT